jgi:quinol-cytochrome oxidoreductase complex cytochrome b subunit
VEFQIFGHPLPALFWPGIVMPGIVLGALFAWPWIDARIAKDSAAHDVLVPASRAPWRLGVGVAFLFAAVVLTFAASDDQQALMLHVPVTALVTRIEFCCRSAASAWACSRRSWRVRSRRGATNSAGLPSPKRVVALRRNAKGGFDTEAPKST